MTLFDTFGLRNDGTKKGMGFFGPLKNKDGQDVTELSIGINIDGKETEIPLINPTLNSSEINHLVEGGKPTEEIIKKSYQFALERIMAGKSPFADDSEIMSLTPSNLSGLFTPREQR